MNWMKYRYLYFAFSGLVIFAGVFGFLKWGFKFGIDFTGGTVAEYNFSKEPNQNNLIERIDKDGMKVENFQKTSIGSYLIKLAPVTSEQKTKLEKDITDFDKDSKELRFEVVGPLVGPELIRKTIYALLIAASLILLWVAYQFKSFKFGTSAILAMFHDSLVVLGSFALFGHFFGAEIDFLFVTAMLTVLSFSVHDTIIVYDRIRESQGKSGGDMYFLANKAIDETIVRSLNNSFTIIFMLVALVILGGESIRWFATALLVGTISGAYSSPFVAIPLLVTWDKIQQKLKKRK